MTREEKYIEQLKALGTWDEAFRPEVSELAQLEREKTRVKKAWSATVPKGCSPSFTDPLYGILCGLRREILVHREALGLTPKSLRRLRGVCSGPEEASQQDLLAQRLEQLAALTATYSGGREAVPESGTDSDG